MTPFERVHELIISGKVIGPDGSWISRTDALKEKRALLQHILGGEVKINGRWTRLSEFRARRPVTEEPIVRMPPVQPLPSPVPPVKKHEFEKETAVMPPPQFDIGRIRQGQENHAARFEPPTLLPPLPPETATPPVVYPNSSNANHGIDTPQPGSLPEYPETHVEDLLVVRRNDAPAGDAIKSQQLPQDEAAPLPDTLNFSGNALNSPTFRSEIREDVVPTPQLSAKSGTPGSAPPPESTPTRKLDRATLSKASGADNPAGNTTAATRTVRLGKQSSLIISESYAGTTPVSVCSIEGFIDQSNSDTFNSELMSMLESGVRNFVVDLERTVLVGSAGWGVLAVAARMIKIPGGRLVVCSMKPEIKESFNLLQFGDVIDARATLADSIESILSAIESQPVSLQSDPENSGDDERNGESFKELPLPEKIRSIISRNGPLSLFQIAAHLRQDQYGNMKMGLIKLHFLLKDLNLDTNWKRVRFYRSC